MFCPRPCLIYLFDASSTTKPCKYGNSHMPHISRIINLHFCRWQHVSIFVSIFLVSSVKCNFYTIKFVPAVQGHPRSLIFNLVPVESSARNGYPGRNPLPGYPFRTRVPGNFHYPVAVNAVHPTYDIMAANLV